jgi:transcriptional regulator with XRE-family HTH domain
MDDAFRRLAQRASLDPHFLGHALNAFARKRGGLSENQLASALGTDLDTLSRLRLCRMPRVEPDDRRADIARIAQRLWVSETKLREVLGE